MNDGTVPVTCLGCGCTCDDLRLTLAAGTVASVAPPCPLAIVFIGDGQLPAVARAGGAAASRDEALAAAASLLQRAGRRVLVVLAPGLPTASYGAALAIADQLNAAVETPHSAAAAEWILAGQRRGRAVATLGEPRHRADLVVYWGVDPAAGWPRFAERFAEGSTGLHAAERAVVRVTFGATSGTGAGEQLALRLEDESAAIGIMRAALRGSPVPVPSHLQPAVALAERMAASGYVSIVTAADQSEAESTLRAEGLLALAQQLNGPTSRCALTLLRAGGNVAGIESLLTWQTGFPFAVDFATGAPTYHPDSRGASAAADAALVVGDLSGLPASIRTSVLGLRHIVIGPRASVHAPNAVASIDTGLGGLHEAGTAYRMDDVPLPLTAPLAHPHPSLALLHALHARIGTAGIPA